MTECPYMEICPIPNLDTTNPFIKGVCITDEHHTCVDFLHQQWPSKNSAEWRRRKRVLRNLQKEQAEQNQLTKG